MLSIKKATIVALLVCSLPPVRAEEPSRRASALATTIVCRQDSSTVAIDALKGEAVRSGADAGDVIQWAIDHCGGGTVMLRPGEYRLRRPLLLPSRGNLIGQGAGTILRQTDLAAPGLLYIGSLRKDEVEKKPVDARGPSPVLFRRYGVTGHHVVSFTVSDLQLVGPGAEGTGDGIHLEYANSYAGPCSIQRVYVHGFGGWQLYGWKCFGGAFTVRDSKFASDWVGEGLFFFGCHGGRAVDVEVHDVREGGTGVAVSESLSFALESVVSENNKRMMGTSFLLEHARSTTLHACYSEQSQRGVVVRDSPGPVTIRGGHFADWRPVQVERSHNVIIEGNSMDCPPANWCVFVDDESRFVRVSMNDYWHGRGYNRAAGWSPATATGEARP